MTSHFLHFSFGEPRRFFAATISLKNWDESVLDPDFCFCGCRTWQRLVESLLHLRNSRNSKRFLFTLLLELNAYRRKRVARTEYLIGIQGALYRTLEKLGYVFWKELCRLWILKIGLVATLAMREFGAFRGSGLRVVFFLDRLLEQFLAHPSQW